MNTGYFLTDAFLYIGRSYDPESHSHHAAQICIGLDRPLMVEAAGKTYDACSFIFIGANVPHRIRSGDATVALLYLEKEGREYEALSARHGESQGVGQTPRYAPAHLKKLLAGLRDGEATKPEIDAVIAAVLACFGGAGGQRLPLDLRITRVMRHIRAHPAEKFSHQALAAIAALSASRLSHLFKAQVGVSLRRYILWARIRHAITLAQSGNSLLACAHEAGFSDSAHFTRTFRAMFGMAPSRLFPAGKNLRLRIVDEGSHLNSR
ncbi:MAG: helix-turn-helix transcriptional regulator [Pseudomonadota bacterium]|jgi:AraC family transcriptional regulator